MIIINYLLENNNKDQRMKEKSNIFINNQESSDKILFNMFNNNQNSSSEGSKSKLTARFGNQESEAASIHSEEKSSEVEANDLKETKEETEEESKEISDIDERSIRVSDLNQSFISEISEIVNSIKEVGNLSDFCDLNSRDDKNLEEYSDNLTPLFFEMTNIKDYKTKVSPKVKKRLGRPRKIDKINNSELQIKISKIIESRIK